MRVYDTEIRHETETGSIEIVEYHDEGPDFRHPSRWNARVVVLSDNGIAVTNLNRGTQTELYQALDQIKDLFESATTAVLDAATEGSRT